MNAKWICVNHPRAADGEEGRGLGGQAGPEVNIGKIWKIRSGSGERSVVRVSADSCA